MGKNRGFKPQGLQLNPIKRVASGGPSLAEKLGRNSRPTWDQLHKMLKKKEASNSEFLEKYENECFSRELQNFRNSKIEEQERQHLEAIKKEARKRQRRGSSSSSESSSSDDKSRKKKRKREKDKKRKQKKQKRDKSADDTERKSSKSVTNNPFRLSTFFEMEKE
ncbi:protein SREK1IP1-like [Cyclospora cayetanensis]|uniref:Protein SREK1IP1-like n=1 Tax=Cyclospora cayetanensis TaxID=88456 RepID=A0A6P6S4G9_9EIME|nr:protein SREK1IP1-like [Cyclospora cayetanensis]